MEKKYQKISFQVFGCYIRVIRNRLSKRFCVAFGLRDGRPQYCALSGTHSSYIIMYVYGGKWRAGANLVGVFTDVFFIYLLRAKDKVPSAVGRAWRIACVIILYIHVILCKPYILLCSINRNDNITMLLYKINTDNDL